MFGARNLINTPNRKTKIKSYEFTPIGTTKNTEQNKNIGRSPIKISGLNRPQRNSSYIHSVTTTFDNTDGEIDETMDFKSQVDLKLVQNRHNTQFEARDKNFINNGFNSIKEQNSQNSKLETENYNLKIKLATITKFLDSTPEEQKNLINQNIELKQSLVEMHNKCEKLMKVVESYELDDNKENRENDDQSEVIREKDEIIREKNENIKTLQNVISDNDEEISHLKRDSMYLKGEVEALQDESSKKNRLIDDMKSKIDELKYELTTKDEADLQKIHMLERSLKENEEEYDIADARIEELEGTIREFEEKIRRQSVNLQNNYIELSQYEKVVGERDMYRELVNSGKEQLDRSGSDAREKLDHFERQVRDKQLEIDGLKSELSTLKKERHQLQNKDEVVSALNSRSRDYEKQISKLESKLKSQEEKLEYFTNEYEMLQQNYDRAEADLTKANTYSRSKEHEIEELKQEREELISKLQRLSSSKNKSSSALDELESFNRKRLEKEIESLKEKLSNKDNDSMMYYQDKIQSLKEKLAEKETDSLRFYQDKIDRLDQQLNSKNEEINQLTKELKLFEGRQRAALFSGDEEKNELIRLKATNESKIRLLNLEIDNLTKEFEAKLKFYENQFALLEKTHADTNVIEMLEKQIKELTLSRKSLNEKISEQIEQIEELNWRNDKITSENKKLNELISNLEKNEVLLKLDISNFENKIKSLNNKNKSITKDCERLTSKLITLNHGGHKKSTTESKFSKELIIKCRDLQADNNQLNQNIEQLNRKFKEVGLSSSLPSSNKALELLENKVDYYKAKLYDMNIKANDLEFLNEILNQTIKNSQNSVKREISHLRRNNIYPDYSVMSKSKPTFKSVAKMVLATVRLKNRIKKRNTRDMKIRELRDEIEFKTFELYR